MQLSSTSLAPGTSFEEDNFFMDQGWGGCGWFWDNSSTLHVGALYFYYYYISSTSDHQALEFGGWGPRV